MFYKIFICLRIVFEIFFEIKFKFINLINILVCVIILVRKESVMFFVLFIILLDRVM